MKKIFFLLVFLLPVFCSAQGWVNITPGGLSSITHFRALHYKNSDARYYIWNRDKGYRIFLNNSPKPINIFYETPTLNNPDIQEYPTSFELEDIVYSPFDEKISYLKINEYGCVGGDFIARQLSAEPDITQAYMLRPAKDIMLYNNSFIALSSGSQNEIALVNNNIIYRSEDNDNKFSTDSSLIINYGIHAINYFTSNPNYDGLYILHSYSPFEELYVSKNKGKKWIKCSIDNLLHDSFQILFHPTDAAKIFLRASDGIYASSDTGSVWTKISSEKFSSLEIDKDDPEILYAGNSSGELFRSSDDGKNYSVWNNTFTKKEIIGIYKPRNSDTVIVAAHDGVFKVFDFSVSVEENFSKKNFSFDIAPNPIAERTTISSFVHLRQRVQITLFDTFGNNIFSEEKFAEGKFSFDLDAKNFSSGVYFVKLSGENFSHVKMMNVVK